MRHVTIESVRLYFTKKLIERLSRRAKLTRYVQLALLPRSGWVPKNGHPCLITGWGITDMQSTNSTESIYPNRLQGTDKLFVRNCYFILFC